MQLIRRKASHWAYSSDSFVKAWRTQRMKNFLSLVKPPNRARIIDLGGSPYMWQLIDHDFNVTLVNLPSKLPPTKRPSGFTFVEGDATNLSNLFEDKSFEIVYANSVIEHVGDEQKQAAFAAEVYRLANSYWVQTPSDRCPIEPTLVSHITGNCLSGSCSLTPLVGKKLPAWKQFIDETRVLPKTRMSQLFPDGEIYVERKLIFEKSYSVYRPFQSS